jgi:hypothetical protein
VKSVFAIVLLSLLVTACDRRDAELQHRLVGAWARIDCGVMTLTADGNSHAKWTNFLAKPVTDWAYDGTWGVKGGIVISVITNATAHNTTNLVAVGSVERWSIVRLESNQLVLEADGHTNSFERRQ